MAKRAAPQLAATLDPGAQRIAAALTAEGRAAGAARVGRCTQTFGDWFTENLPAPGYVFGRHTTALAQTLTDAAAALERGQSAYYIVTMPPRHGKSDLVSRSFPAWLLLRAPDTEVILATYGADLSEGFSRVARRKFQECAPRHGLAIAEDLNQVGAWGVRGHRGGMFAVGLGGAITGRGAHALIVDDYCKNRQEAESQAIRDSVWDSFRNDLFTRLAPAHVVVIVATRWHEDDLVGRIVRESERDPAWPAFRQIRFPAWDDARGWLFPERFPAAWYERMRAAVGSYAWEALYQGDPHPRTGRLLRADLAEIVERAPADLPSVRGWDLASTGAERLKDDPDYTVGTRVAWDGQTLWVLDVTRGRWAAGERNERMVATALADGPRTVQRIEAVAGYVDCYNLVRERLRGRALVRQSTPRVEKVARWSLLEPLFEGARVKVVRAPWNREFLAELGAVPGGAHDDQADSLVIAAEECLAAKRRARLSV